MPVRLARSGPVLAPVAELAPADLERALLAALSIERALAPLDAMLEPWPPGEVDDPPADDGWGAPFAAPDPAALAPGADPA